MRTGRRKFIRNLTLGAGGLTTALNVSGKFTQVIEGEPGLPPNSLSHFNMCGYAAPPLNQVRIGFIGLGMRGPGAVQRMAKIEGVQIVALCDKIADRVSSAQKILEKEGLPPAASYTGNEGWKSMVEKQGIDLIYICTPWSLHTPMAVYAMKNGKHVAVEVPAAVTEKQCWELVETSEKTKKHCMMLENCCYDFFELLTLNMARNGLFGEIVHAEGAYIHDLRELNFKQNGGYENMWRLQENATRNGNLYPTHGLGPIAQCLNINRGDKLDYLVSLSSADFMMAEMADELAKSNDFYAPYSGKSYRGNMNSTLIKTQLGKSILVQHDVTSPRPYSRIHLLSGTKGIARKWPGPQRISFGHTGWINEETFKTLEEKYTPEIVKHVGEIAQKIGGHGGMDFIMDWRLIDCLRNGLPLDQDVYDAASWSVIAPLSEQSVAKRSGSVNIPDFTRGTWKTNTPVSLTLEGGGNTVIRNIESVKPNN